MIIKHSGLTGIVLLSMLGSPAWADGVCRGTLTGSVLQPLPRPTAVSVVQPVTDDANPALARQYLAGVQSGGFTVVPAGQGNTQIDVTTTVTGGPGAGGGAHRGFSWMNGMQLPNGAGSSLSGSTISLSIEATDTTTHTLAWIGTVACTASTGDPNALAKGLGELTARVLGKSVEQRQF